MRGFEVSGFRVEGALGGLGFKGSEVWGFRVEGAFGGLGFRGPRFGGLGLRGSEDKKVVVEGVRGLGVQG